MLDMFWIALELSNLMVGLITRLSLLVKNLTAFKFGEVAKSGNAALKRIFTPCTRRSRQLWICLYGVSSTGNTSVVGSD